ncbi:MAG: cache domain-containing sensor histidine kinase [Bacillota bacterium]
MISVLKKLNNILINLNIQSKLLLSFALLIIGPLFLMGGLIQNISSDLIRSESKSNLEFLTYQITTNIDLLLNKIINDVYTIQSDEVIQNTLTTINSLDNLDNYQKRELQAELTNALFRLTNSPEIEYVRIVANNGLYAELDKAIFKKSVTYIDMKSMYEGKGKVVWYGYDASTDTIILSAVINSISTQKPIGYLVMNIRQLPLSRLFSKMSFKNDGELLILDENGYFISYNKEITHIKVPDKYLTKFDKTLSSGCYWEDDNVIAYHRLSNAPWYMMAVVSTKYIEGPLLKLRTAIKVIEISIVISSLLFAFIFSKTISKPVKKLSIAMTKFSEGDLDVQCDITSSNEIGQLSMCFNYMVKSINNLIENNYNEMLLKKQAELKSLRMQVNPHFLYNTLDTINWIAISKKVPEISVISRSLGNLMRATISGSDFVTIRREMETVDNYLTIQRYRYGDKLDIRKKISDEILDMHIPKLIIQPILENSIIHGMSYKNTEGIRIHILGLISGSDIIIRVRDNGVGIPEDKLRQLFDAEYSIDDDEHTSIGLRNVDTRLKMYYGDKYGLTIYSKVNKGTKVVLRFPGLLTSPENN